MEYSAGGSWPIQQVEHEVHTMQVEDGVLWRRTVAYSAGESWLTLQVEQGVLCRWTMAYSAGGPWHTLQVDHGVLCRWNMSYSAGGPWPILCRCTIEYSKVKAWSTLWCSFVYSLLVKHGVPSKSSMHGLIQTLCGVRSTPWVGHALLCRCSTTVSAEDEWLTWSISY